MGDAILEAVDLKNDLQNDSESMELDPKMEFGQNLMGLEKEDTGTSNVVTKVEIPAAPVPEDAKDEWPEPKQMREFYFVKFRSYEDPALRVRIEEAEKEVQRRSQARFRITESLKSKRSERANIISQLRPLTEEGKSYRAVIDEKRKNMEPLQAELGKIRSANNAARERSMGLCSSEEELNEVLQSLHYRMQHETITLNEEKQLLKEIKLLEGTRKKVISNAATKVKLQDSLLQKEVIQNKLGVIGGDLDEVRKEQAVIRNKMKPLEEKLEEIKAEIEDLQKNLLVESERRDKANERLVSLRKEREEGNACFYEYRMILNKAKGHAARNETSGLEELSSCEMEKFMISWCSSESFRDDYVKKVLPYFDIRQMSRDGRMRNRDEKPLTDALKQNHDEKLLRENPPKNRDGKPSTDQVPRSLESHASSAKVSSGKAEVRDSSANMVVTKEVPKHTENKTVELSTDTSKTGSPEEIEKATAAFSDADALEMKEKRRMEEMAKAKQALERKKKLAERAAAKAAIRAQKEAEKKIKEREKRAKKRAGGLSSSNDSEVVKSIQEVCEPKEENTEAVAMSKIKEVESRNLRPKISSKSRNPLPKAILKRKRSSQYWIWAIPAASVLASVLVALVYYNFS